MFNKLFGKIFLSWHQSFVRIRSKAFSIIISGAFAEFGEKSVLVPPVRLNRVDRIKVGSRVFIGSNSWLQTLPDGDNKSLAISIGNRTSIVGGCTISAVRSVTLDEDVLLAGNVYISDHKHQYTDKEYAIQNQGVDKIAPVLIGRGTWIGQNVVIGPGVTIGIGSVVGANSFVNKDVPDYCIAAGSPAKIIKKF